MMLRILLSSSFLLLSCILAPAQQVVQPLQMNAQLILEEQNSQGLKAGIPEYIPVDLDSSKYIFIDDFSYNAHRPNAALWKDKSVYVNRNFPINPVTIGVATFDGMDEYGYPYNFITATSYGPCDTLTTLPIKLGNVDAKTDDPIYLTFYYQAQGLNPNPNSFGDSLTLQFYKPYLADTIIDFTKNPPETTITYTFVDEWIDVWGADGYDVKNGDVTCAGAFRKKTLPVPPALYQDSFQFRFINYGNTSGNIDVWHLDFVVLSSDVSGHAELGDFAFVDEIPSLIKEYESMPWFHWVGNESQFSNDQRMNYKMRNTFGSDVSVDLEYRADDENKVQIDSIISSTIVSIPAKTCVEENMPATFDPKHIYVFPSSSAPADETTYFLKKNILKRRIGNVDLIELNNTVESYQIFGSYYAYDDGSAEAGYGLKSDDGEIAVKFFMPEGVVDTLTAIYMHFNPVIIDRSNERFRLTVWNDDGGKPGDIIYENPTTSQPIYPKRGVNYYHRFVLDESVLVSDTFFVGYQKISGDVMNIGYDLNREKNNRLYYNLGSGWVKSSASPSNIPPGAIMIRPSFRNVDEVMTGIESKDKVANSVDVNLYPNPTTSILNVVLLDNLTSFWIAEVYAIDGRKIDGIQFKERAEINVSSYNSGIFILKLTSQSTGESLLRKFLVQ